MTNLTTSPTIAPQIYTKPLRGKCFTMADFQAIFGTPDGTPGTGIIPNWEPVTTEGMFYHLTHWGAGGIKGRCLNPAVDNRTYKDWCTYWLSTTQSGHYDGQGWVLVSPGNFYRFAICKHEIQLLPSARPMRGIHDQFCTKCGMDLSYDSSG
jgi:hypothetical protein